MRFAALLLLLLAGCQRLFQLQPVRGTDAPVAADAAGSADAVSDGAVRDTSAPGPALIQQSANNNTGTGLDVALPFLPINGHVLVVIGGAPCGLAGITGGGVSIWQIAAHSDVSPTVKVFYGVTDGSSESVHLAPQCMQETWGLVTEWSGLPTINDVDTSNQSGMTTTIPGTLNMAVYSTSAPDLLVLGIASYGALGSPASSWTELDPVTAGSVTQRTWYQVVATTGQHTVDVTYQNDFDAALAAFRSQ